MKTNFKILTLSLLVSLFSLGSCQEEVIEITNPQNDATISADSPIVALVEQTTQLDGSLDNILDNSSCTTVVLPVTVFANEQEVVINTEDDYVLVERIFDELDTDIDVLVLVYPITVILADHEEETINNDDEFADLIEDCLEGGADDDIECIDFVYPLDISIYDGTNQVLDVITVSNDEELHDLFESLEEDEFLSFIFPLTLLLSDGSEVVVYDNSELEDMIEDAADSCDEDDDNDFNDDDIDDSDLLAVLLNGEWAISYFFDDSDETANFNGYVFNFIENGTATATLSGLVVEGTWASYGDDGTLEIDLDFGLESPLDELNDDWGVIEFAQDIIKLKDDSDGGSEEYLTFERPVDGGAPAPTLSELIIDGNWIVANYRDSGDDETANYDGFNFSFNQDGTVAATDGITTVDGSWDEFIDGDKHKLALDMGSDIPFDEFAEDWDVVSFTELRIELTHVNSDETTDTLVFEKQ